MTFKDISEKAKILDTTAAIWQNTVNAVLTLCEPFLATFVIYPIFLSIYYENACMGLLRLYMGIL